MALLLLLNYVDSYLMIISHWMLRCQYGSPPLHVTSQSLSLCPKQLLEHCRLIYLPHLTLPLTTLTTHLCWGPICNLHSTEFTTSTPSQPVITASTTLLNSYPSLSKHCYPYTTCHTVGNSWDLWTKWWLCTSAHWFSTTPSTTRLYCVGGSLQIYNYFGHSIILYSFLILQWF